MWIATCDFKQCGILTWIDTDEPVQPTFKLRNSKWYSVSSLIFIEHSSDLQRLWLVCAYAPADLSLCWSHISHFWKSHATVQLYFNTLWQFTFFNGGSLRCFSNNNTMGCPPAREDNPLALASGLSYVQVDKQGITIYTTYTSIDLTK